MLLVGSGVGRSSGGSWPDLPIFGSLMVEGQDGFGEDCDGPGTTAVGRESLFTPSRPALEYGRRHMFTDELLRRHYRDWHDRGRCVCGELVPDCEVARIADAYGVLRD